MSTIMPPAATNAQPPITSLLPPRPEPTGVDDCGACRDRGWAKKECNHGPRYSVRPRPGKYHPVTWADGVMPLWEFGDEHRHRIEEQVARRTPPSRWIGGDMWRMTSRAWYEWHWARGLKLRSIPDYRPRDRRKIKDELRLAVYERDGWKCLHCGAVENLSLDHIHPYSRGGEDVFENLQTLCRPCNSRKGARI